MAAAKDKATDAPAQEAPASDNSAGPEIVGKISTAKIIGKIDPATLTAAGTALMRTIGIANGYKTGKSTYGDWTAFKGSFECVRLSDGATFVGSSLFLPPSVTEMIYTALQANIDKESGEMQSVQFAFEIGVKKATNPIGYEYTVKSLVKAAGADPLAALRNSVLALAAPKA